MMNAMKMTLVCGLALVAAVSQADAGILYGVVGGPARNGSDAGALVTIDPITGIATVVGTPISGTGLTGLAVDSSGRLLASTSRAGGPARLIEIDPLTGLLLNIIGELTLGGSARPVTDLAYDPINNILYGMANDAPNHLVSIDVTTGELTSIAFINDPDITGYQAIGFSSTGVLYEMGDTGAILLNTVDPSNALVLTTLSTTGQSVGALGLAVRPSDGMVFFTEGDTPYGTVLYSVDPVTGVATSIGPFGLTGTVHDLAFLDLTPVPEPSSLTLLGMGAIGLVASAIRRRRRTKAAV